MKVNYHRRAIQLLAEMTERNNGDLEQKVLWQIAQSNPKAFVDAYLTIVNTPTQTVTIKHTPDEKKMAKMVSDLCSEGRVIAAIKAVRTLTGWGLKESKDFVDAVKAKAETVSNVAD